CWGTTTRTGQGGPAPPCGAARSATCGGSPTAARDGDRDGAPVGASRRAPRSGRGGGPHGAGGGGRGRRSPAHARRRASGERDQARPPAPGPLRRAPRLARRGRRGGRVHAALVGARSEERRV